MMSVANTAVSNCFDNVSSEYELKRLPWVASDLPVPGFLARSRSAFQQLEFPSVGSLRSPTSGVSGALAVGRLLLEMPPWVALDSPVPGFLTCLRSVSNKEYFMATGYEMFKICISRNFWMFYCIASIIGEKIKSRMVMTKFRV